MPSVHYLPDARHDLKNIGRFIAEQSSSLEISRRYLTKIRERCELHAIHSEMGTLRPDIGYNIRCFSVDSYVVFFRPITTGVEVIMVAHGFRDIDVITRERVQ